MTTDAKPWTTRPYGLYNKSGDLLSTAHEVCYDSAKAAFVRKFGRIPIRNCLIRVRKDAI